MNERVKGKKALVTGAGQGIGASTARLLASQGARVLLTDRDEAAVQSQAASINADLGTTAAHALRHDVTSESAWIDAISAAEAIIGGLSILVNNAA
jgi:NAD(P)-dependent dehydrogenase (short-subunit alcohol dehydrogenase family)